MTLDDIDSVDIPSGRYKYILIKLTDRQTKHEKFIVRGYTWAAYHGNFNQLTLHSF